jgi:uncharacterized peroxidase-related enzyme
MPRIQAISYQEASGRLKVVYDDLIRKRGKLADVHTIQSLRPESIVKHMDLYLEIMFSPTELSRAEREMIAVVVSVANECAYCLNHHETALRHYVKDEHKIKSISNPSLFHELPSREEALCHFARQLTLHPQMHENNDFTTDLKKQNLTDAAILDAVLIIAYFNFVNRIVLSLGLGVHADEVTGYNY